MNNTAVPKNNDFEIVFAGRSNVGKSSIVKALSGSKVKVGKRPGVTLKPTHVKKGELVMTDLPGFGFMNGVKERKQDIVKDKIVRYIEEGKQRINIAAIVVDAGSFVEVVDRWDQRGELPIDIEIFDFFTEMDLEPLIVVNKMDKIKDKDQDRVLDDIIERLGLFPPWRQWIDRVAPISAKKGDLQALNSILRKRIHSAKRDPLLKYI
ncbi:GTP-binding protein EngB [Methanohalophilus mahii]|uniref:Probable GTP-binding protein EngB n=1 Tax=Methanohalophilus mahii (strain ATCC 35705 / DSM 5219 / SLP) TaxID=547558 RepID=D5EC64_METMS|nr:GTP-binding protein EngB [Methanohalophilus mahii]ADE36765.1 GTP-binding protein HSR1-related protein [Methanohalophilus mahii DSM 5219]